MFLGGVATLWFSASAVHHLAYQQEFCFAEWCVTPTSYAAAPDEVTVGMRVRSDARSAVQRPDHPQAWLIEGSELRIGGRQPKLERVLGPGETFDTSLAFPAAAFGACPRLLVSEGAWPAFLGLGYAPSPFTESVDWPLCKSGLE